MGEGFYYYIYWEEMKRYESTNVFVGKVQVEDSNVEDSNV